MTSSKFISLFVTATALLVLVLAKDVVAARAPRPSNVNVPVNPFCKTSDFKMYCNNMVKGATNLKDASLNALTSTLDLVKLINSMENELKREVTRVNPANRQAGIVQTCQGDLKSKIEVLESSIEAMKTNDIDSVAIKLSAGASGLSLYGSCAVELRKGKRMGMDANSLYFKKVALMKMGFSNCLAVVQQK